MKQIRILLCCLAAMMGLAATAWAADGITATTATVGGASAQVVYVDLIEGRTIVPAIANNSIHTDAQADAVISSVKTGTVVAAINGGFFNSYYNPGAALSVATDNYPRVYSTIVREGVPLCAGGDIAAIGADYDGKIYIDRVKLTPTVTLRGETAVSCWGVNSIYSDKSAVYVLTEAMDYPVTTPADATVVTISDGTVTGVTNGGNSVVTKDGALTLVYGAAAYANAVQWGHQPRVGDSAVLHYNAVPSNSANTAAWSNMRTVIAGGGMLVQNGKNVTDSNTTVTAADQQPDVVGQRTFVAQLSDGRLMLGTVTSSLRAIADSLVATGAQNAIFLDGGASSMLYADGSFRTTPGRKLATVLAVVDETGTPQKPAVTNPVTVSDTPSAWAEAAVETAKAQNILPDNLAGKYQRNITRKEFCDLIAKFFRAKSGFSIEYYCSSHGLSVDTGRFSDCTAYYVPYVAALGVIDGYPDGTFRPNEPIQRQDAAIMLQRLANRLEVAPGGSAPDFTDAASISAYAQSGVSFVTAAGIMNGNADGSFSPRRNITREQAIITMVNAYDVF